MNGLKKGFLGLMILSALGWSIAPLSIGAALADNAAPKAPAAKPAPKKAAAKKPVKKKVAKKHPRVSRKGGAPVFIGTIAHLDMNATPMTITAIKHAGMKHEFVFGGDITSKTAIYKGKKRVRMSALHRGQRVVLRYRRAHGTLIVTAIHIH